jgi:hypothetical protein
MWDRIPVCFRVLSEEGAAETQYKVISNHQVISRLESIRTSFMQEQFIHFFESISEV